MKCFNGYSGMLAVYGECMCGKCLKNVTNDNKLQMFLQNWMNRYNFIKACNDITMLLMSRGRPYTLIDE